jgi:hypothetical protein
MVEEHRFQSWNIFDSALTTGAIGHHYWETKTLADELLARGEPVRIFCHRDAPAADLFPGAEVVPAFSLYLYAKVSKDPAWQPLETFIVHNRAFHADLGKLDPALFRDSVALFPTVRERQLLGIIRWLAALPADAAPHVALCLMPPDDWTAANTSTGLYKTVWNGCAPALKRRIVNFSPGSVVLLPYSPRFYRWNDSSIYHEAKLLDAPVLMTAGTWMADEVTAAGNGLVIRDYSADAVVECIARAQRERPALKAAAVRVGSAFRRSHGVARCIEALIGAFQSTSASGPRADRDAEVLEHQ